MMVIVPLWGKPYYGCVHKTKKMYTCASYSSILTVGTIRDTNSDMVAV